jgi:hypothetical protein
VHPRVSLQLACDVAASLLFGPSGVAKAADGASRWIAGYPATALEIGPDTDAPGRALEVACVVDALPIVLGAGTWDQRFGTRDRRMDAMVPVPWYA